MQNKPKPFGVEFLEEMPQAEFLGGTHEPCHPGPGLGGTLTVIDFGGGSYMTDSALAKSQAM
jgi:hypothetical protein